MFRTLIFWFLFVKNKNSILVKMLWHSIQSIKTLHSGNYFDRRFLRTKICALQNVQRNFKTFSKKCSRAKYTFWLLVMGINHLSCVFEPESENSMKLVSVHLWKCALLHHAPVEEVVQMFKVRLIHRPSAINAPWIYNEQLHNRSHKSYHLIGRQLCRVWKCFV